MCQEAVDVKVLEMSTPQRVQVNLHVHVFDFQRFTLPGGVKIMTFAANWQNSDSKPDRA